MALANKLGYKIVFIGLIYWCSASAWAQPKETSTLTVSILVFSVEQRNAFERVAAEFAKAHPGTVIDYIAVDDPTYKAKSVSWLTSPDDIDVMNWPWPARLREFSLKGLVEPVSDLWAQPFMQGYTDAMRASVTVGDEEYAIPYASGFWGFYYNKSLFATHRLAVPKTTDDLLQTCRVLKQADVVPFAIGVKAPWPLIAWFDYFNLRINGLNFYFALARGEISFTDPRVVAVFDEWKRLVDNQCFFREADQFAFRQIYPLMFRQRAAMLLSGNFFTSQIPDPVRDDIGFFPFPIASNDVDHYELAPTDMFIIPKGSDNKVLAKAFLAFIAKPHAQSILNNAISFIPTHPQAAVPENDFLNQGKNNIYSAAGVGQYFDRDASQQLAETTQLVLRDFLREGDVNAATTRLERARQLLLSSEINRPDN